jgi:arylformamidase
MPELDLEAEYNNRARVPDNAEIAERWAKASAAYRSSAPADLDVPYGPGPRHRCDIYHPVGGASPTSPLVVYIHGGYWQRGDREPNAHVAKVLNGMGLTVALPSYDLCPNVRIGDIVNQIRDCLVMLWRRMGRHPVVAGHSAGGHLTAAMLTQNWSGIEGVPADLVRAGCSISGVFDVEPLIPTSLNEALRLDAAEARALSVHRAGPRTAGARFVAAVGGAESGEFLRQSRDIVRDWGRKGARTELIVVPDANHFTVVDQLAIPRSPLVSAIARLAQA